ncbi:MAG: hypothetical protein HY015_02510 [Bacteroidetes bacterium]|nr:hypothetical protein [Bacteroidota bacterium]MBI3481842.1 hypothetical protein [Bacteroidota bacterium]
MTQRFVFLFLVAATYSVQGQDVNELARRNGFKDIKLGSSVDSVKGARFQKDFTELKEFEAKLYAVKNPSYEKIGDADVKSVELKVYKGLIYEIIVTTPKDPRIMRGLEKSYGKATYNLRTETYSWRAPDQISLVYKGHHKEVKLIYKSHPVIKIMYADKKKKIEEIADDF